MFSSDGLVFPILLRRLWLPLLSSTQQVFFSSLRLFFLLPSPHPLSGVSDMEGCSYLFLALFLWDVLRLLGTSFN